MQRIPILSRLKTIQHNRLLVVFTPLLSIEIYERFPIKICALIAWLQMMGKFVIADEQYNRRMEIKDAPDTYCLCHQFRSLFSPIVCPRVCLLGAGGGVLCNGDIIVSAECFGPYKIMLQMINNAWEFNPAGSIYYVCLLDSYY